MPFRSAGNGPELFFRLDFEAAELAIHYIVNSALFRLYIQLDRLKVCRVLLEIILPHILCGLDQSLSGIGLPVKLYADFCLGSCGLLCYLCCSLLDVLLYFCGYFCCLCFCLFSDSLYVCLRSCGLLCSRCLLCCGFFAGAAAFASSGFRFTLFTVAFGFASSAMIEILLS